MPQFQSREEYERWKAQQGQTRSSSGNPAPSPQPPASEGGSRSGSYVEGTLASGEVVRYRATLHWGVFIAPAIITFVLLVVSLNVWNPLVGLILGALILLPTFITYRTSEFAVTNRRVLAKVGLIRRRSLEILLSKVEAIQVEETMLGRLLGYGTIVVAGTGGSKEPFTRIDRPFEFRKAVQEQIEAAREVR